MANLLEAETGQITLNDQKLKMTDCAFIFQNPENQFVYATVIDDLAFGLENINVLKDEIEKKIKLQSNIMQIDDFLSREVRTLSGGEQQKIATTAMLLLESKIIVCDESTSMLDSKSRFYFRKFLRWVVDSHNYTVISITHDLEEAYQSDRVSVIEAGRIILQKDPVDLWQNYYSEISHFADKPFLVTLSESLNLEKYLENEDDFRNRYVN